MKITDKTGYTQRALTALYCLLVISLTGCGGSSTTGTSSGGGGTPASALGTACITDCFTGIAALALKEQNTFPVKLASDDGNHLYVSDTESNSVFIYEHMRPVAEIKDLDYPLGVTVDGAGLIYIGNMGRKNVEVYDRTGVKVKTIGDGSIGMPNALAIGMDGKLYVADSIAKAIKVFAADGTFLLQFGQPGTGAGKFDLPIDIKAASRIGTDQEELYVADQAQNIIQVFNTQGTFLRTFGGLLSYDKSSQWHGLFTRLQAVEIDHLGRLHALDSFNSRVQILDPVTGAFILSYGSYGNTAGKVNIPLDIVITKDKHVFSANRGSHRVDVLYDLSATP